VTARLLPHHDGSPLHVSTAQPALGEEVLVRLRVPHRWGAVASVRTRSNPDREPRYTDARLVGSGDGADWWEAPVLVENPEHGYRFLVEREDGRSVWVNATGVHELETLDAEDFLLVTHPAPPSWLAETVLYQVFPDRFARSARADGRALPDWAIPAAWDDPVDLLQPGRSQQVYGGDLDGVAERLDHIQELGATAVYLTPFFPGRSNHRYDASTFGEVDPLLGGDDALVRLVEAAHARGLRVIGDLTANHCGDGHEWFRAAYGDPGAPESDFFYWLDDEHTRYVSWLGVPSLPKFNWNSAELRRRFIEGPDSVVGRWLCPPFSLDGWRIDVANMTGRYRDDDLNAEVRRAIRRTMIDIDPDTILLAESTNDATGDFRGDAWHGAMTYANFTRPVWSWLAEPGESVNFFGLPVRGIPQHTGRELVEAHTRFTSGFPWRTRQGTMNALDTHDTPRFATAARPGAVPVALGLSVALPGVPVVFAGDEFGLTGVDGEASRTPIPWGDPAAEPSMALYRELLGLRRAHPALSRGGMRWLHVGDDALAFVRESAEQAVLVVATRAPALLTLPPTSVTDPHSAGALVGTAALTVSADGAVSVAADGPSFSAWELPAAGFAAV
jgi:alpha-glucosidase